MANSNSKTPFRNIVISKIKIVEKFHAYKGPFINDVKII